MAYPDEDLQSGDPLVLDLSSFSDEDMGNAFRIWMDRITRNPEHWNNGFNLTRIREEFRNFINAYGDSFLSIIERIGVYRPPMPEKETS